MKSLKKTLVLLVVLSMILSAVSPVFAFNDVIDEDYAEQANKMAAFGVFTGDAEGNFNAEENITRAEMAVVIGRLMGLTTNEANANQGYASNFSDVAAGEWYTGWVNLVAGRGIISGFPDGTFRPNEKVTQAQAVTMIVKALGWGVVVDQTGTWPANYITKASELRLFKNAVETDGELVTRGNVAIYCYNALTAKTWDVAESTDGQLTSKKSSDTILAKYFSDFVNEDGEMKLVEEAYVALSGANTTEIGKSQIKLVATVENTEGNLVSIASFIDAEKEPKKGEEEVTYKKGADVVAYVPAEVANIANLAGRKVDVIFGADNEVAYIAVTDDSVEGVYVTAWDKVEEIEIDGEEYEFAADAVIAVYGHVLPSETITKAEVVCKCGVKEATNSSCTETSHTAYVAEETAEITVATRVGSVLNAYLNKDELTRNIVAEFILDGDDEIESINFKLSADEFTATTVDGTLEVNEFVVEKISSKNVLTVAGTSKMNDLDDYEDAEPRVIKNGVVAEVADIEVGDVVTEVVCNGKVEVLVVVANAVEGEVTDYLAKTNTIEIDGTEYKVVALPFTNDEGETDEYADSTAAGIYDLFEDETVTAYLNMAGEIVAVVGESEATGMILGVVTKDATTDEDSDDVEYAEVRILAEDGSEKKYKVYNEKSGKDLANDDPARSLKADNVIMFSADADRVIKSDDLTVLAGTETDLDFKSNSEVSIVKQSTIDDDNKKLDGYRFSSSTVVINPVEEELISNWEALVNKSGSTPAFATTGYAEPDTSKTSEAVSKESDIPADKYYVFNTTDSKWYPAKFTAKDTWLFVEGTKIVYVVAWIDEANYGVSDDQYGIVIDTRKDKDEDDETIYVASILVDGKEVEYEVTSTFRSKVEEGSFITFDVADGEIDSYDELVNLDVIEYIADLDNDTMDLSTYVDTTVSTATSLKSITVESVEKLDGDTYIVCEEYETAAEVVCKCGVKEATNTSCTETSHTAYKAATTAQNVYDLSDDYVVYGLEDAEMAEEIAEGDYILVIDIDPSETDGYEIVIVL